MEKHPKGAVLVVDDMATVRNVLASMVAYHGYIPLPAESGVRATEIYRARRAEVRAAVVDVQMPEMDGPATLAALREIDPGLPCVFVSSGSGDYGADRLLAFGSVVVLNKPELLEALGSALAAFGL
ncbi:response regulator [Gemmata sp. G18]|uniref:Response regulator n=1 Tax=Gemmata palustris TaxID=2822762 RepID=A0ABS5BL69_9BACT|nr:response regulator [Gemmata palustris]MBP3954459.1 response regulator [Gemmata palustris]